MDESIRSLTRPNRESCAGDVQQATPGQDPANPNASSGWVEKNKTCSVQLQNKNQKTVDAEVPREDRDAGSSLATMETLEVLSRELCASEHSCLPPHVEKSSERIIESAHEIKLDRSVPPLPTQLRFQSLRQAGDFTLAYNTAVQVGLEYFWSDTGYVAYMRRKGQVFVLGDPVTRSDDRENLLGQFLAKFPRSTFVQISSETAIHLEAQGYYINEMGVDTILDLPTYSFGGKAMERIRYAGNWLTKHGYAITEFTYAECDPAEVAQVSDSWRSGMRNRRSEMRFLNRPLVLQDEPDVRKFLLRDSTGQLVAFFYFDPLYRDGKIIGYTTAIKRRSPDAPIYAEQGIMRSAVEKFKAEGKLQVNLGLSPMAWIENKRFRRNPLLHFSFRYAFNAGWVNRYFYNLIGHAQYKRHFKGREVAYHYASPVLFNDFRITNLLRLTGVY